MRDAISRTLAMIRGRISDPFSARVTIRPPRTAVHVNDGNPAGLADLTTRAVAVGQLGTRSAGSDSAGNHLTSGRSSGHIQTRPGFSALG